MAHHTQDISHLTGQVSVSVILNKLRERNTYSSTLIYTSYLILILEISQFLPNYNSVVTLF